MAVYYSYSKYSCNSATTYTKKWDAAPYIWYGSAYGVAYERGCSSYSFNGTTGLYELDTYYTGVISQSTSSSPCYIGVGSPAYKDGYIERYKSIIKLVYKWMSSNSGNVCDAWNAATDATVSYSKGNYMQVVTAVDGTYPENGRHTDGYWYMKEGIAQMPPTISNISVSQAGADTFIVSMSLVDPDSSLIKYQVQVNGTQYFPASGWSDFFSSPYTGTVSISRDALKSGNNTIKITASDGSLEASNSKTLSMPFSNITIKKVTPTHIYPRQVNKISVEAEALQPDGAGGHIPHSYKTMLNSILLSDFSLKTIREISADELNDGTNTITIISDDNQSGSFTVTKEANGRTIASRTFLSFDGGYYKMNIGFDSSAKALSLSSTIPTNLTDNNFEVVLSKYIKKIQIK